MSNCKHLKLKLNRQLECKLTGKIITWNECKNCVFRRLNLTNINKSFSKNALKNKNIVQKSSKLNKLERNRKSIFTDDLDHCIICGVKKDNLHEVFFGSNRLNSIKYDIVIPLCVKHHQEMHKNKSWQDYWHIKGQQKFNEVYPDLSFIDIFKRNYL